jgi:hypothetical protein
MLTAVLVLLEQEISDQQCEGIAEAPGEGTFRCPYPDHAGWVYVHPLRMKSFHEELSWGMGRKYTQMLTENKYWKSQSLGNSSHQAASTPIDLPCESHCPC